MAGYHSFIKKFFRSPRWGVLFALGRFRWVSNVIIFFSRRPAVPPAPGVQSLFAGVDTHAAIADLERDGLHTDINLDAATVAQIVGFADTTPCYWGEDRNIRFLHQDREQIEQQIGKSILLGRYFEIEERCPAVRDIAHDPILGYLAAQYLGTAPGQIETRLWWSFAGEAPAGERLKADQGFHYDLHDYRSIAFFFHLTAVDEGGGPHVHIKGSHVQKPLKMLLGPSRQSTDEEMVAHYGAQKLVTLCGPPGFGFASDPFGYHKGAPPLKRDRLMLRIRFTINDDGSRVDRFTPQVESVSAR